MQSVHLHLPSNTGTPDEMDQRDWDPWLAAFSLTETHSLSVQEGKNIQTDTNKTQFVQPHKLRIQAEKREKNEENQVNTHTNTQKEI